MSLYYNKELVRAIGKLREAFILDNVETSLFNPHHSIMEKAGVWAPFLRTLIDYYDGSSRSSLVDRDIAWEYHSIVHPSTGRTTRWMNITRLGMDLNAIVALAPAKYFNDSGAEYTDYRFSVFCNCDEFLIYTLLLKDYMTGK